MNLEEIKGLVISALFSDPVLFRHLVLKGGNALELVHHVVSRGSVDIDFSISDSFDDTEDIQRRILRALRERFMAQGVVVFDFEFQVVPPIPGDDPMPWWGGYVIGFKLISREKHEALSGKHDALQIQAMPIDLSQNRTFKIDISKHEYCRDKIQADLNGQTIYVYTEEMCVLEKLRAICQQLPEYCSEIGHRATRRGRDFYDIYATISRRALDLALSENLRLCRAIFDAKRVPLNLIPKIHTTREFHRPDWDSVRQSVRGEILEFDYYFEFVLSETKKLKPLWVE